MSLALFRSQLRTAVREAQDDVDPTTGPAIDSASLTTRRAPQADLLRQVARGELSVETAVKALRSAS